MYSEKGPNLSTAVEVFILILTLVLVFLPSPCEASPAPTYLQSSRMICECGNTLRYSKGFNVTTTGIYHFSILSVTGRTAEITVYTRSGPKKMQHNEKR